MKTRALTIFTSILVMFGLIVSGSPTAQAATSKTQPLPSNLAQVFREEARAFGLSDAQIAQALKHPEMITTPTSASFTVQPNAVPASSAGSNSVWVSLWYNNILGMRLMTFNMTKDWSWAGGRVTAAPPPIVKASVSTIAQVVGWQYDGVVGSSDYFYDSTAIAGTDPHSAHRSYRQGKFHVCAIKLACFQQKLPVIDVHVNGIGGLAVHTSH